MAEPNADRLVELFVEPSLTIAAAYLAIGLVWASLPLRRSMLESSRTHPKVPWNALDIAVCYLAMLFLPALAAGVLLQSGLFTDAKEERLRLTLTAQFLSFPLIVMVLVGLPIAASGATRTELGFRTKGLAPRLAMTRRIWLVLTPIVFVVFVGVNLLRWILADALPDRHPLANLGAKPTRLDWSLFFFEAVFAAPIREEILYRGLLLPWLLLDGNRARALYLVPIAIALMPLFAGIDSGEGLTDKAVGPIVMTTLLLPLVEFGPQLYRRLRVTLRRRFAVRFGPALSTATVRGLLISSLIFAVVHANVWPSPIPLLILSLGLGYVAIRTRSVLCPIVFHAAFNAISALAIVFGV